MKIGVLVALPEEVNEQDIYKLGVDQVRYTGVGKVNVAIQTMDFIKTFPDLDIIINLGTAGSSERVVGEVVRCSKFIQRDFDLPFPELVDQNKKMVFTDWLLNKFENLMAHNSTCATGDNFAETHKIDYETETGEDTDSKDARDLPVSFIDTEQEQEEEDEKIVDCVDMEAYAIAKACFFNNIPFMSIKYISDNANVTSRKEWLESLQGGSSQSLLKELNKVIKQINS